MKLVIDASVAVALVLREATAGQVTAALSRAQTVRADLLVPSLLWLEVINALGRGRRLEPPAILEAVAELDALELETVDLDRPMLLLALDAVARHGLTAYDAAYLALAEWADAELLTADARLAAAAGDRAMLVGGNQPPDVVAETPASYGTSWADWPGAAAYLRQLRVRVLEPSP
ncbi:MAG: type II toxin-antitoxin system VapC family toxin [Chloroflexota bacterium]